MLRKHILEAWLQIVMNYSARKLSYPLDKVIAIDGILDSIHSTLSDNPIAGMWKTGLWRQLTWWIKRVRNKEISYSEGTKFMAPTWSWLNARDSVLYHNSLCDGGSGSAGFDELRSVVNVMDAEVQTCEAELSGKLVVVGHTYPYHLTSDDFKEPIWKRWNRKQMNKGRWWLDEEIKLPADITCLVLAEDNVSKMLICLCLIPVEGTATTFRRVGLCHWEGMLHEVERCVRYEPTKQEITIR
jgi:hypothetical protein